MYMLIGFEGEEFLEQYFTNNEGELAVHIALEWAKRKLRPRLYHKTWNSVKPVVWKDLLKKAA